MKREKVIFCLQFGAIRKFFHIVFSRYGFSFTHIRCARVLLRAIFRLHFIHSEHILHRRLQNIICQRERNTKRAKQPFGQLKIERWIKKHRMKSNTIALILRFVFACANFIDYWHMLFHWTRHFNHAHCNFIRFPLFCSHDLIIIITFEIVAFRTRSPKVQKWKTRETLFEVWANIRIGGLCLWLFTPSFPMKLIGIVARHRQFAIWWKVFKKKICIATVLRKKTAICLRW